MKTHPTADELYERVRARLPRISLGTVYRNLEILSQTGRIRRLVSGGAQKRYDGTVDRHYHIRCVGCGAVVDCPLKPLISFPEGFRGLSEYEIHGHHLEFVGLCPACKAARRGQGSGPARHEGNAFQIGVEEQDRS